MKIGKLVALTALILVIALVLPGCAGQQDSKQDSKPAESKEAPIVMKVGGISPPDSPHSIGSAKFTELVTQKSNGRIKAEFYPASQLGGPEAQLENLRSGTQDIIIVSNEWISTMIKDFAIMGMPYAFRDVQHLKMFFDSEEGQKLFQRLIDEFGIRIVDYNWWRLARTMISVKPVATPADVKGMKIRVPDIPIFIEHVKQLEASPTPVAWAELYMALKQGVAAAEHCTYDTIYPNKFYEAAPYITDLNFAFSGNFVYMAESTYQKLPPDLQKLVVDCAKEAGDYYTKLIEDSWASDKQKIEQGGGKFIHADREAFAAKVIPLGKKLEEQGMWGQGLLDYIQNLK